MNTKHTPGPWYVDGFDVSKDLGDGAYQIARVDRGWDDESSANARLISAAPELLQALNDIVENGLGTSAVKQARAALAKATGGSLT